MEERRTQMLQLQGEQSVKVSRTGCEGEGSSLSCKLRVLAVFRVKLACGRMAMLFLRSGSRDSSQLPRPFSSFQGACDVLTLARFPCHISLGPPPPPPGSKS